MRKGLNDLVPVDDLHWDSETGTYAVISKEQAEEVVRACFMIGMEDPKDILKVIREYEVVNGGNLLFKQFLSGRIGINGFDESGSPVFEPIRRGL